nr:hypothetical protein CFP56_65881 [Quercus suber]
MDIPKLMYSSPRLWDIPFDRQRFYSSLGVIVWYILRTSVTETARPSTMVGAEDKEGIQEIRGYALRRMDSTAHYSPAVNGEEDFFVPESLVQSTSRVGEHDTGLCSSFDDSLQTKTGSTTACRSHCRFSRNPLCVGTLSLCSSKGDDGLWIVIQNPGGVVVYPGSALYVNDEDKRICCLVQRCNWFCATVAACSLVVSVMTWLSVTRTERNTLTLCSPGVARGGSANADYLRKRVQLQALDVLYFRPSSQSRVLKHNVHAAVKYLASLQTKISHSFVDRVLFRNMRPIQERFLQACHKSPRRLDAHWSGAAKRPARPVVAAATLEHLSRHGCSCRTIGYLGKFWFSSHNADYIFPFSTTSTVSSDWQQLLLLSNSQSGNEDLGRELKLPLNDLGGSFAGRQ